MDEQSVLMEQLRACDFALYDLALFLDTHPSDTNALKDYKTLAETSDRLMRQYESKYGPLMAHNAATDTCWLWVNNPWPWDPKGGMENVGL